MGCGSSVGVAPAPAASIDYEAKLHECEAQQSKLKAEQEELQQKFTAQEVLVKQQAAQLAQKDEILKQRDEALQSEHARQMAAEANVAQLKQSLSALTRQEFVIRKSDVSSFRAANESKPASAAPNPSCMDMWKQLNVAVLDTHKLKWALHNSKDQSVDNSVSKVNTRTTELLILILDKVADINAHVQQWMHLKTAAATGGDNQSAPAQSEQGQGQDNPSSTSSSSITVPSDAVDAEWRSLAGSLCDIVCYLSNLLLNCRPTSATEETALYKSFFSTSLSLPDFPVLSADAFQAAIQTRLFGAADAIPLQPTLLELNQHSIELSGAVRHFVSLFSGCAHSRAALEKSLKLSALTIFVSVTQLCTLLELRLSSLPPLGEQRLAANAPLVNSFVHDYTEDVRVLFDEPELQRISRMYIGRLPVKFLSYLTWKLVDAYVSERESKSDGKEAYHVFILLETADGFTYVLDKKERIDLHRLTGKQLQDRKRYSENEQRIPAMAFIDDCYENSDRLIGKAVDAARGLFNRMTGREDAPEQKKSKDYFYMEVQRADDCAQWPPIGVLLSGAQRWLELQEKSFFAYDVQNNNCQVFVQSVLQGNAAVQETSRTRYVDSFMQKAVELMHGKTAGKH